MRADAATRRPEPASLKRSCPRSFLPSRSSGRQYDKKPFPHGKEQSCRDSSSPGKFQWHPRCGAVELSWLAAATRRHAGGMRAREFFAKRASTGLLVTAEKHFV